MGDTPNIRFKGFTDDWKQRKLGDFSEIKTGPFGSTLHADDYVADGVPIITTEHFKSGNLQNEKDGLPQVSIIDYKRLSAYILEEGDLVFSRVGSVDINALITTLHSGWLFSGRVLRVRPSKKVNCEFLHTLLETEQVKMDIRGRAVGQTMPSINTEILRTTYLVLPSSKTEQVQIGTFFRHLDNLITLHQRKHDEIIELKKYMLQKMFPQNAQKIPEFRFTGFTEGWEQRKLGDIFKEYSEKHHEELPALTIIQGGGTILREESDRNLQYDKSNLSGYKMVKKGDFIVRLRSFEGGLEKANTDGIISPAYHILHGEKIDSRFYYPYFRSYDFINRKLVAHVYGIRDGRSIDIDGMKTIEIPYTSLEEQKKIGDYIEILDNLITLQQKKCDELKNVKKFMLQNMFV